MLLLWLVLCLVLLLVGGLLYVVGLLCGFDCWVWWCGWGCFAWFVLGFWKLVRVLGWLLVCFWWFFWFGVWSCWFVCWIWCWRFLVVFWFCFLVWFVCLLVFCVLLVWFGWYRYYGFWFVWFWIIWCVWFVWDCVYYVGWFCLVLFLVCCLCGGYLCR